MLFRFLSHATPEARRRRDMPKSLGVGGTADPGDVSVPADAFIAGSGLVDSLPAVMSKNLNR